MYNFVVRHAFGSYKIGDTISDEAEMTKAEASNPHFIVRIAAPPPPPPVVVAPKADAAPTPTPAETEVAPSAPEAPKAD